MAFLRKYATATHIYLPVIKRGVVDFAVSADWSPASGDVKVSIDGGTAANIGTLPTAVTMGNTALWDFTIATGEVTGKKITIMVADSATKAVEDQCFLIETYGHASAEYQADFSAANLPANVAQFGGTNGHFSSGRPEANVTYLVSAALDGYVGTNFNVFFNNGVQDTTVIVDDIGAIPTTVTAAVLAQFSDHSGTAQAGAAGTITLASGASSTNDYYNGAVVSIYGGTGAGQSRKITAYVGSTRVATVDSNWVTTPDNTSTYFVIGRIT